MSEMKIAEVGNPDTPQSKVQKHYDLMSARQWQRTIAQVEEYKEEGENKSSENLKRIYLEMADKWKWMADGFVEGYAMAHGFKQTPLEVVEYFESLLKQEAN